MNMTEQIMELLSDMSDRMARMETKIDRLHNVEIKADQARDLAREALQHAKSAHLRIDRIEYNLGKIWMALFSAIASGIVGALLFYLRQPG